MASRARTAAPPTPTRRKTAAKTTPKAVAVPAPTVAPRVEEMPAAAPVAAPVTKTISNDQIAERAYYIWLRKGRPFGQDDQNWLEAVAELTAELSATPA